MTESSTPTPWSGFKYQPVRGRVDRHVARFLRTQRKNMRRFFAERGHVDLYQQLEELRLQPNRNFMQKNKSFQRILSEHIKRSQLQAAHPEGGGGLDVCSGSSAVAVRRDDAVAIQSPDAGGDAGGGVPALAPNDINEPVIEE